MTARLKKTDNHNLAAKLAIRRYFLDKYHAADSPDVLDCCQGGGVLWDRLRAEYAMAGYLGLDVKPKKGRLKLDSVRMLQLSGWRQNVIDVDTYGSPWKHWLSLLSNVRRPLTVFLTWGRTLQGGFIGHVEATVVDSLGLRPLADKAPPTLLQASASADFALGSLLARSLEYRVAIREAVEAVSAGHARYFGLRLEPEFFPSTGKYS